jgi:hypothetical protein
MRPWRLGLVAVVSTLALPTVAHATTFYTAPSTSNTTGCTTPATACEIHYAIGTAPQASGDEVVVLPGTYNAGTTGITASKAISIHGQTGSPMPEIDGATNGGTFALLSLNGGSGTRVSDLKLVQSGTFGPPSTLVDNAGGARLDALYVAEAQGVQGIAVALGPGTVLADSVAWAPSGQYAVNLATPGTARVENVTAEAGSIAIGALNLASAGSVSVTVENSIARGGADDLAATSPMPLPGATASITVGYSNYATTFGTIDASEGHNQTTQPALVGAASGDFHELASSATVDNGIASAAAGPADLAGLPRALGAAPDIGAYELPVPLVSTGAAQVTGSSATLNGTVNPETAAVSACRFDYGTGPGYGSSAPCTQAVGSGSTPVSVSAPLRSLAPGTLYRYRVVAVGANGTQSGLDATLTTPALAPTVTIAAPANGAQFVRGQVARASYTCAEGAGGPGIASCAGTVASDAAIDTFRSGSHTFTVTATSRDGQAVTARVTYTVSLPSNRFTLTNLHTRHDGTVNFDLKFPWRGGADVLETAWKGNRATAARLLAPAPGRFVFARKHLDVRGPGVIHVEVKPNADGKKLIAHHRYRVVIRLWVSFTPTLGGQRDAGWYGLHFAP